jgi:pyrroloquinoline quinone biosynthesis protein B
VSLPALASLDAKRKVFTHINNTNPLLDPGSKQAKVVADAGWEVAWDGMEIVV